MKGQDIYSLVRSDPLTEIAPENKNDTNSRNRYNVLTACTDNMYTNILVIYNVIEIYLIIYQQDICRLA